MSEPDILDTYDAIAATLDRLIGDATVALYDVREKALAERRKRKQAAHYADLAEQAAAEREDWSAEALLSARDQVQGRAEDFQDGSAA